MLTLYFDLFVEKNKWIELKATWKEARETCCATATTLATVQTNGKRNCMAQFAESELIRAYLAVVCKFEL